MLTLVKNIIAPLVDYTEEPWARVVMNRETREWVNALDTARMDALEISGEYWGHKALYKSYRSVWYPEYDICVESLPEKFDIIFAEQVFEHLLYPLRAAQHVYQMLQKDGYFLLTTPFLFRVYACPTDCTRWTPQGMSYFLEEAGFSLDKIRVGSWGNQACVKVSLSDRNYCSRIHSLRNDANFPVVVWALAQK